MADMVRIELFPSGKILEVEPGTPLPEVLFAHGAEFPCGGRGKCRGCRVKVRQGELPVTKEQERLLGREAVTSGWRLACLCRAEGPLTLELAQWEAPILADQTPFRFTPQTGYGVAVDLGTTTVAAQLLDRRTGEVLAVETALNPQAQFGADIMTRIERAMDPRAAARLTAMIRTQIGDMIQRMLTPVPAAVPALNDVVIVGNTVMHHLFCGLDITPLAGYPFATDNGGLQVFAARALRWDLPSNPLVRFLPCLGGFVGSDILAGILATRLHQQTGLVALVDLGTNGEIVVGKPGRLLCASTAAGPAFEGARISMGMRAATGAISEVNWQNNGLHCRVLGGAVPTGICGSGLVDAVATGLELGWIRPNGRLADCRAELVLREPVRITPADIRELQLAKGAIAAGLTLLLKQLNAQSSEVERVYLAGAFGNYINRLSARRIGLWNFSPERVEPAGNTALLGAKLALFDPAYEEAEFARLLPCVQHVGLSSDPRFEDVYLDALRFPDRE